MYGGRASHNPITLTIVTTVMLDRQITLHILSG